MYTINMSSCEMCGGAIGEGSGKKPKYNTKKFAKDFRNVQQLVGSKTNRRKVGDAATDKAVKMIGSGDKKSKYNTKKFAKDFRTVQQLVGTKSQRRKVGDAGTDKAVKMIGSGPKKTSAWISHVKKVMADKGISYKEALSVASQTYKKN